MNSIQYGIDTGSGLVWSKVGIHVAVPVLQYDQMKPENSFKPVFELEVFDLFELAGSLGAIKWTRKIPHQVQNMHREFWGMKPLGE